MSFEILGEAILERIRKEINSKQVMLCEVVTPPPNITIRYSGLIIPKEQIMVANHLLPSYHRQYVFKGDIINMSQKTSEINISFKSGETTTTDHKHGLVSGSGSAEIESTGVYELKGDLWLTDTLKEGNIVRAEIINNYWVITDHVVAMPSDALEGA
ncbi:MAG: DUF2577 family protein [Cetobacterium sp.]|uniref:DUF2577 family protein n=1 Tax=Cetobacterium sp. TaxID=2071632 RepID=UPI003F34FFCC